MVKKKAARPAYRYSPRAIIAIAVFCASAVVALLSLHNPPILVVSIAIWAISGVYLALDIYNGYMERGQ